MSWRRREIRRSAEDLAREHRAIDEAWQIHGAQLDWTAKADAKAAFAFGVDSAIITTVAVLMSTGRVFVHFGHWYLVVTLFAGLFLLVAAIIFASVGVAPRLRRKQTREQWRENFVYFGHARHWDPQDLAISLQESSLLPQLTRQIQVTATVAWKKHVAVNWAIWLTLAAGAMIALYTGLTRI